MIYKLDAKRYLIRAVALLLALSLAAGLFASCGKAEESAVEKDEPVRTAPMAPASDCISVSVTV